MFPNPHDPPASPAKRPIYHAVPRLVTGQLLPPVLFPGPKRRRRSPRSSDFCLLSPVSALPSFLHRTFPDPLQRAAMLRTAVPETAIHKHGHALTAKDEIRPDVGRACCPSAPLLVVNSNHLLPPPADNPCCPQQLRQRNFRPLVAASTKNICSFSC